MIRKSITKKVVVLSSLVLGILNTAKKFSPWFEHPQNSFKFKHKDTFILIPGYMGTPKHLDGISKELSKTHNVIHLFDKEYRNTSVKDTNTVLEQTLIQALEIIPKTSKIILLGHSYGGLSALLIGEKYSKKIKKIVTLSTPLQGDHRKVEIHPSSKIIEQINNLNLHGLPYDCHTTSLDHVVPHKHQIPSKKFLNQNKQTRIFTYEETHWPFQQKAKKYVNFLYK